MHPILFTLPFVNMPIYGYGLMMVFSFLGCQWLSSRLATRYGLDPEIFVNATLVALVSGVIGARLSHVLENLSTYTDPSKTAWQNLYNVVNIRSGGLTYYGGLIGAAPVVLVYFLVKKVPARLAADIGGPCITLGLGIGRLGCFLNGCCYGADTNLPWAVTFPYYSNAYVDQFERVVPGQSLHAPPPHDLLTRDHNLAPALIPPAQFRDDPKLRQEAAAIRSNPVHPTQLYSTFTSLLITALCLAYLTMPHAPGRVFALMLLTEGPTRFILELLRVEPAVLGPMSLSMVIGIIMFAAGAVLWVAFGTYARRHPAEPATADPAVLPAP